MAHAIWHITLELAPWLLLGAFIAGLLHGILPPGWVRRRLRGKHAVWQSVVFGIPLPLCSCGVIPAGIGLKKNGASNGAAFGFLISTPQTGVDSIMVAAAFLGWPFALFKVAAAAVMGLIGGTVADALSAGETVSEGSETGLATPTRGLRAVFTHGIEVIRSVWLWLVFGVLASAAIEVWLPARALDQLTSTGGTFLASLTALLISLPMYVCTTSSIPIATALVDKGLPFGAALVFLMAGPATNVATIGAIFRTFGLRLTGLYLGTIIGGSIASAFLFDWLFPQPLMVDFANFDGHSHTWHWISTISAGLLVGLFGWFAVEDLRRFRRRPLQPHEDHEPGLSLAVEGMTCQACVRRLETDLVRDPEVVSADVQLHPGQVTVSGSISESSLRERIRESGFEPGSSMVTSSSDPEPRH